MLLLQIFLVQSKKCLHNMGHAKKRQNVTFTMFNPLAGRATFLFTGAATILSFVHSMFTSLDSIGSAVGKRPIEHVIATSEWPTEY